jgi:hypothetical protein
MTELKCGHDFASCEPEDILKDVTVCVNCNRQLHYYQGRWYHWSDLPAEADDSDFGIEMNLLNASNEKAK